MNPFLTQRSLVIGGDGFIGSALADHLSKLQAPVLKTTRNVKNITSCNLYFDMQGNVEEFKIPEDINTAYICAAESNIEKCEKNPSRSYLINTQAPIRLAKKLVKKNIFVIFLSTSAVFDGKSPRKKIEDSPNPMTTYGFQKLETELGLKEISENILVVRLTKTLSARSPLLKNWLEKLSEGKIIHPFSDMTVSPIHIDYLTDILITLGEKRRGGILQVSGESDATYENLARCVADIFSFSQDLVQPICSTNSDIKISYRPLYTSLDTSETEHRLNLKPQKLEICLKNILLEYKKMMVNVNNSVTKR